MDNGEEMRARLLNSPDMNDPGCVAAPDHSGLALSERRSPVAGTVCRQAISSIAGF